MSESVNVNVTAKEGDSERVPQRFNFENSGTKQHKKGDIYEYTYHEDVDIGEDDHRPRGLIIIDLSSGGVQTADVSGSAFDLLRAVYGLMDALELPMEAAIVFPIIEQHCKAKATKDALKDIDGLMNAVFGDNDRRPSGMA